MWQEEMKWIFNPFWLAPERVRLVSHLLGSASFVAQESINLLTVCWSMTWWLNIFVLMDFDTKHTDNKIWPIFRISEILTKTKKKSETKQGGRTGKSPKELHETESVGQAAWRPTRLVWWDMMMMMMMTKQAWSIITIIMHNDTIMSLQCLTYNWFTSVLFWCDSRRFPLSITLIVI